MRAYVFTGESLKRYAGRFVWLSINTEDSKNAGFLAKYPIAALPTLFVLDPPGDTILLRYVGGATLAQLEKWLAGISIKIPAGPDSLVRQADRVAAANEHGKAASLYASAIKNAPKDWKNLGPVSESLLFSLRSSKEYERCAAEALALVPRLRSTRSGANVAAAGLDCGLMMDEKNPRRAGLVGGRFLDPGEGEELAHRGLLAGCQPVMVRTGRGVKQMTGLAAKGLEHVPVVANLAEAVDWILSQLRPDR